MRYCFSVQVTASVDGVENHNASYSLAPSFVSGIGNVSLGV